MLMPDVYTRATISFTSLIYTCAFNATKEHIVFELEKTVVRSWFGYCTWTTKNKLKIDSYLVKQVMAKGERERIHIEACNIVTALLNLV